MVSELELRLRSGSSSWRSPMPLDPLHPDVCAAGQLRYRLPQSPFPGACDWRLAAPVVSARAVFRLPVAAAAVRAPLQGVSIRSRRPSGRCSQASKRNRSLPDATAGQPCCDSTSRNCFQSSADLCSARDSRSRSTSVRCDSSI